MAMTSSQLEKYLAEMNSQEAAFEQLVELLGKPRSLQDYHAAALAMAKLQSSLDKGYGSRWMTKLCQALACKDVPISTSLGYRLITFAEVFPGRRGKSEVRKLDHKNITWDSMMRIIYVKDKRKRKSILKTVSAEHHHTRDVRRLISKKTAYRHRGRRVVEVTEEHPNQALRNLVAFASKWRSVRGEWLDEDEILLEEVTKFLGGQATDDFRKDLESVAKDVIKMAKSAKKLSTQLTTVLRELPG